MSRLQQGTGKQERQRYIPDRLVEKAKGNSPRPLDTPVLPATKVSEIFERPPTHPMQSLPACLSKIMQETEAVGNGKHG